MIADRADAVYTYYEDSNLCKDYEIDNSFLFDLLQRTKYNTYLKFVADNLVDFTDYYFEEMRSEQFHKEMCDKFDIKSISEFRKILQIKLGIDLKELIQYFQQTKSFKSHRAVTVTQPYSANGEIEYQAIDSSYIVSLYHPEAIIHIQNLSRPTIRFNRNSIVLAEIDLNLADNAMIDYIAQLRKYHEKNSEEFSLTDLLEYNQNINNHLERQRSKRSYYADLLFIYDRTVERHAKNYHHVYPNISSELKKRNNKDFLSVRNIKDYHNTIRELIPKLEEFISKRWFL
ncbi:MAG: hypothetical protein PHQ22_07200 [Sulfuricurvum sp.]|nr:hypothetical protein [Sulfuricurvum sp.]MDD5386964.1 hypothetical protein [Sulfuricurvum sp.]